MTTDQQIIELLKPILTAAKAIDPRMDNICLIFDKTSAEVGIYCNISGVGTASNAGYGTDIALAKLKPYDPKAELLAAIAKKQEELAALETESK